MKGIQSRTAFTMIELIFVIVILGILAAIALPKFAGMQEQAEVAIVKSYAGTLSRTVGPMMWSTVLSNDGNGSIKSDTAIDEFNGKKLPFYTENFPKLLNASSVNFDRCIDGPGSADPFIQKIGVGTLNIFCRDGDPSNSPRFEASAEDTYTF